METRISRILKDFQNISMSVAPRAWRKRLAHGLSFLFFGFLFGNLFGTFLSLIRMVFPWDGFIVIIILFFMELISYSRYHSPTSRFLGMWKGPPPGRHWNAGWNALKIGFLLGFFIDAYKVGS